MFLKLMDRATGGFRFIEVVDCVFHRLPEPSVTIQKKATQGPLALLVPTESVPVTGLAFLQNDDGKTIDTFNPAQTDRKTA